MATGIQAGGTDLDSLFLPLETTKRSDVGWDSNGGVDISNRFEPYASGTKVATTGIQSGGVDLADLFQNISVPLVTITWPNTADTILTLANPMVKTGARWINDGNSEQTDNTGAWTAYDDWLSNAGSGTGSDYEIKWTQTSGDAPNVTPGTEDTWIDLGTTRELSYNSGIPSRTGVFVITIRKDGQAGTEEARTVTLDKQLDV